MTQKELLYVEDAIGHDDRISNLISSEINNHETIKNNLLNMLEVKSNE